MTQTQPAIIARLHAVCWHPPLPDWTLARVRAAAPRTFVAPHLRSNAYDVGRVRHFYDILIGQGSIEPIEIETEVYPTRGGPPEWGNPFIVDGRHRFVAAVLAGCRTIPATYGGLVEQISWLTGRRQTVPRSITL